MGLTNFAKEYCLNWLVGSNQGRLALFNGDPSASGVEVTTQLRSAGRLQVSFGAVASALVKNAVGIAFGPVTASVTVTHFGICDGVGNILFSAALPGGTKNLAIGDRLVLDEGQLQISIA